METVELASSNKWGNGHSNNNSNDQPQTNHTARGSRSDVTSAIPPVNGHGLPAPPYGNGRPRRGPSPSRQDNRKRPGSDSPLTGDDRVKRHYNSIQARTFRQRKESAIIGVRNFNNFIKALLIDKYTEPHSIVLDFACGKGGDLMKWLMAGVDGVIGVDIADSSIEDAKRRFAELNSKTFWTDFVAGNLFEERIEDIVHPDAFPVDAVSCQFALHYAFDTEERARCALGNISRALKRGCRFIGTIPNPNYLAEHLKEGKTAWGNSIFNITFDKEHPGGKFDSPFGNRYMFHLKEAVVDVPEFVVPLDTLKSLAKDYDLELEVAQPFEEYFYNAIKDQDVQLAAERKKLVDRYGNIIISPDELEACIVYLAFVFVKV